MDELLDVMDKTDLNVICVTETKWKRNNKTDLQ